MPSTRRSLRPVPSLLLVLLLIVTHSLTSQPAAAKTSLFMLMIGHQEAVRVLNELATEFNKENPDIAIEIAVGRPVLGEGDHHAGRQDPA